MILKNKNVLITGASGGLGSALAKEYFKKGCNLFLTGYTLEKLSDLCEELQQNNFFDAVIKCRVCNFNDSDDILNFIKHVKEEFVQIDIIINCAGVFPIKSIEEMDINQYRECIEVNLTAPFILIKEFSKEMIKNKWGRIINIASSSAYSGATLTSAYCASKHALLGLSRALHKELKCHNVRVFCVSPGSIQTPMGEKTVALGQSYETFMKPEEVAEYVAFATAFDGHMISEEIRLNRIIAQ